MGEPDPIILCEISLVRLGLRHDIELRERRYEGVGFCTKPNTTLGVALRARKLVTGREQQGVV